MRAVTVETLLVGAHQQALADGGTGLQMAQVGRAFIQSEPAEARADGAGAYQRDLAARKPNAAKLVGEGLQAERIESSVFQGQDIGADLDHGRVGRGDDFLADRVDHASALDAKISMACTKEEIFHKFANVCLTGSCGLSYTECQ